MVMFDVQVSLPLDATTFLKEKDSDAYKAFHSDAMGTVEQELLSSDVIDGEYHTVTRMVPSIEIPWALRRAVLGNKRTEFIDKRRWAHGSHLTAPFSQTFHITNNITDRCVVTGTILIADETHGTCLVRAQGEAIVTLKGFGPAVEKLVVNNLKASYDKLPGIVERWMRRGESPAEQNNLSTQIMPNRMRTRTRRDSTRRTGAFGSVIDMHSASGYDVETGGLAHGNNRYDDEFKSPEAKARAFGKSINFVARGRSLLANAFAGEPPGGETSKSRSLRTRGSNTRTTKRLSKHKKGRYICGVRRSTFLFLVFLSVVVYFWFSFLPTGLVGPGLFSLLSRDSAKLHKVEETVESVVEAELEVFDAVEHMAEDIEHGQEEAVERAVGHEHAARVAAEKDDAHRYIHADNDVSCVDTRAEECAMWACGGECSANPGFMNEECACACAAVAKHWIGNMDESIKPGYRRRYVGCFLFRGVDIPHWHKTQRNHPHAPTPKRGCPENLKGVTKNGHERTVRSKRFLRERVVSLPPSGTRVRLGAGQLVWFECGRRHVRQTEARGHFDLAPRHGRLYSRRRRRFNRDETPPGVGPRVCRVWRGFSRRLESRR